MTLNTMDTVNIVNIVNTLINSFHDIWHLPALRLVNKAWCKRPPRSWKRYNTLKRQLPPLSTGTLL